MPKGLRDRIKDVEEQLEALIIALPKEEASHRFYKDLANNTEQEGTRKMFLRLADQELDHKQKLEQIVEELKRELEALKARK